MPEEKGERPTIEQVRGFGSKHSRMHAVRELEKLRKTMEEGFNKLASLLIEIRDGASMPVAFTENGLLSLPQHLQETMRALSKRGGRATAPQVATLTRRSRAVESSYLNQLVGLKWLTKSRDHRNVVYTIKRNIHFVKLGEIEPRE